MRTEYVEVEFQGDGYAIDVSFGFPFIAVAGLPEDKEVITFQGEDATEHLWMLEGSEYKRFMGFLDDAGVLDTYRREKDFRPVVRR